MTDRISKPRQRKKRETKGPIVIPDDNSQESPAKEPTLAGATSDPTATSSALQVAHSPGRKPVFDEWTELEADEAIAAIRYQYKFPTMYQPPKAVPEALDVAFISHFVQLNKGIRSYSPEIPWITHLPEMHVQASKPALRLSIRSASMAFYATVHKDPAILVDSYRWYTMSLNCQRQTLARLTSNSMPSEEEILVPIILALYEVYAGTTQTSVFHHLAASTKILEMRGPSNCKGLAFPLFKSMRISDVSLNPRPKGRNMVDLTLLAGTQSDGIQSTLGLLHP